MPSPIRKTLSPTDSSDFHDRVERFVPPEEFLRYREWGLARGFRECVAGPLVRSSYRAEQALAGNNAGLRDGTAQRAS